MDGFEYDTVKWYMAGGDGVGQQQQQEFKNKAADWDAKLKNEYYTNENAIGTMGMYIKLKFAFPLEGEHPSKRFTGAWLKRQLSNQINKKPHKIAPVIQACPAPDHTQVHRRRRRTEVHYARLLGDYLGDGAGVSES